VRGWAFVTLMVLGCSNLTEGPGGVVELEIVTPATGEVEVGETLQLTARALDRDGNPLDVPITWCGADSGIGWLALLWTNIADRHRPRRHTGTGRRFRNYCPGRRSDIGTARGAATELLSSGPSAFPTCDL
jgi:hypothetical protein